MDWKEAMRNKQIENKSLLDTAKNEKRVFTEDEQSKFDSNLKEIENCKKMIDAENSIGTIENQIVDKGVKVEQSIKVGAEPPIFNSLTENLRAIKNASNGIVDDKLIKLQNKIKNATGMSVGVGADGGFGLEEQFLGNIFESAVSESPILSMVDKYAINDGAKSVYWNDIKETDISSSIAGGVQVYWESEASTGTATKPKLERQSLELQKLMGFAYVTDELDSSSSFADQLLTKAFTTAISRKLENDIISGDGVGKPVGILSSGALVTVSKESSQTADTINWKNITKMYHAGQNVSMANGYAWIVHPDAHAQLDLLEFPVGTGGVPVYTPANMVSGVDMMRGLPVITSDCASAIGDKGDIILANLKDYMLLYRGNVRKDISIHVSFLNAENCFRFIYYCNGRPKSTNKLTIKNSSTSRSKYITLEAR